MDHEPEPTETTESPPSQHLQGLVRYPDPPAGDQRIWVKGQPQPATPAHPVTLPSDYCGRLYPAAARALLAQEAAGEGNQTEAIDRELKDWLTANVPDPLEYLRELVQALQERSCIAGLCARLNLACLTAPTADTITVQGARGPVRIGRTRASLDWLGRHAHFQVRRLCRQAGHPYREQAGEVAARLEALVRSYDLEQILLVRIAYLAAHAQLSNRRTVPALNAPG